MIKYVLLISSMLFASADNCGYDVYNKCMRRLGNDDICNEYSKDACLGITNESCNHKSIRILKRCMKEGKSDRRCNDISSRIFFDCYQY